MASEPSIFDVIPGGKGTVAIFFILLLAGGVLASAYHEVPTGYVGVEKEWEATTGVVHDSGQAWTVPFRDEIQLVEVRPRTYTMAKKTGEGKKHTDDSITVPTQNGVEVNVDVTVRYMVRSDRATQFVEDWNTIPQAEQRLIRPTVRSALRDEGGAIQTSEIYTKKGRQALQKAARNQLDKQTSDTIVIQSVQIRAVRLPNSYQQAVKKKEIEKQEVQAKEYELQKARADKKKSIIQQEAKAEQELIEARADARAKQIRANATAKANRKIAASLTDELLKKEYYEALDRTDTVYFTNGQSPLLHKSIDGDSNSTAEGSS